MKNQESYQLALAGAQFYEKHFIPSIFAPWANIMVDQLELQSDDRLLDVACGTGIVARTAYAKGDKSLAITGYDLNDGMLQVAKANTEDIHWMQGKAEELPFSNNSFTKSVCQFGIMFFQDPEKALREMERVSTKKVLISIWNEIEANEGYAELLELVEQVGGTASSDVLRSPFSMGNKKGILNLLSNCGLKNYEINTKQKAVLFPSVENWIDCDVKASPIINHITNRQYETLKKEAKTQLKKYIQSNGKVQFKMSAHIISITV